MSPSAALVRASTQGRVSRSRSRRPRCRGSRPALVSRRPSTASARSTTASAGGTQEHRVPAGSHFGDRLGALVAQRESQIVLGLDPDPSRLWPDAAAATPGAGTPAERAAAAVRIHCAAAIDAAGPACLAVKPQLACFERLGAPGWDALRATIEHAHASGLLVLADGKRGDIDVSAAAYAQALAGETSTPFGPVRGLGADAYTVSPYMGVDTLDALKAPGAGMFVLVRTSNPGATDVEDLVTDTGERVWERVARLVDAQGEPGPETGLHDVGAVVGATAPQHLQRARELMPRSPFLLPGIGAQGGRVEDLGPVFAPGRAAGLVSASRSIVAAHEHHGGTPAAAAREEAERLRALAWSLA
jgi:orotidine-5'-phosphate decarboxylase